MVRQSYGRVLVAFACSLAPTGCGGSGGDQQGSTDSTTGDTTDGTGDTTDTGTGTTTGTGSGGGTTCPSGTPTQCGESCVDTSSDPMHCGGCDEPCQTGMVCSEGMCALSCQTDTTACEGACVDTDSNPLHCGGCNRDCGGGWACVEAACVDLRSWHVPELIEDNAGDADRPRLAVDTKGNAVAVWLQWSGSQDNLRANHYDAETGSWGTDELLETYDSGAASSPDVAMDASGNAIAIWRQNEDSQFNIRSARYGDAGGVWDSPELVETDDTSGASTPRIAMDDDGNAIAIWRQDDDTQTSMWANRYDAGDASWQTPELIETDESGRVRAPKLAMDADGNVVAVWAQSDGMRDNVWANRYDAMASSWGTATLLETDDSGDASGPSVAMDRAGNAIAMWPLSDGARFNIWASRYDAEGGSWSAAVLVDTEDEGSASSPQVGMDADGNAIAIWRQDDGARYNIWASRYDAQDDTWAEPEIIEMQELTGFGQKLAVDARGNAVAIWRQNTDAREVVFANRYGATEASWSGAEPIEANDPGKAIPGDLAMDGSGNALALWRQSDGMDFHVWASWYAP